MTTRTVADDREDAAFFGECAIRYMLSGDASLARLWALRAFGAAKKAMG